MNTRRALFAQQPVDGDTWIALAWPAAILVGAYAGTVATYRRRIN